MHSSTMTGSEFSPFLHRTIDIAPYDDESELVYAEEENQQAQLEMSWYHMYELAGTLGRPMLAMRHWAIRNMWWVAMRCVELFSDGTAA
jgi:hypothetical protein